MMDKMMTSMMERMTDRMSSDDVRAMMSEIMGQMLGGMDFSEKVTFMESMMGVCIPKVTDGLDEAQREQLAVSMFARLHDDLRRDGGTS